VKLGAVGIEQIVEVRLTDEEMAALHRSARTVEESKIVLKKLT
jgi:malate dehydrogenase